MDFTVLYTHQKTKKSKKWQDGKLRVSNNGKVVLLNDSGNQLETVYVKADQIKVGEEIESDRHLITIEEEKKSNSDNAQIVNQECNGSSVIADHHQRPLMRNPLRKRRMGFTVPRQLNQQQSSSDLSKENIPFNKPHIGYNSQQVDFESSAPLTTTATTYPSNISTPLHSFDIKSQVQPSCFTLVGKNDRNEHEERKVNHCQNMRVDLTWKDDRGVPNYIDQPQGTVDRIHISNSYVQSNEERKHSDNEKSHRPAGKRSASQILALLGKKKQSFQPPLKKTKFETEGNGDSLLSGNVDVREPVTECRLSSVPRERLDGAEIKQLLEVKDHQGEATIDGDHPPQDTSQGMLASTEQNVTGITPLGSLQRDNEFTDLSDEQNIDCGKGPMIVEMLNHCSEHNAHKTLPKSLVTGGLDTNGTGQVVTHLQQSYETGEGMYGVACIHRTRTGEDCGSVEVRIGVNRGQCTGIKQNGEEIVPSDNQSLDATRLATMEISKSSLKDEKIGGDRDGRLDSCEEDEVVERVMDVEAWRALDREHIAGNDNVCGYRQLGGPAGATVMKSDRPENEKTEEKKQDKDQTERENVTAQMYGYKSGKCEDEEGRERGSGYRHATKQHDNFEQTVSVLENNLRDGIGESQSDNLDVPIGLTGSLKNDVCCDGKEVNTSAVQQCGNMEGKQRLKDEDQPQSHKDSWDSHIYAAMVTGEEDLKDMNGGTCSMAVLDGENHIEAVTVSFAEVEDEVRSTLCFAQSKSDLEGKRNDTQKDVDDVITSPGSQKFSAEVMSPVSSGCVYLDIEQPRMETSEESLTPSCDIIMVGFEPMQNNSPSISELQNVVNSTFHAASPMDRNKVGREVQESTENVITSTKNESSNSDKFLTDDREIETESGRSSPGTGSCGRSQVDCTFDTSSDLTTNHSQSSLLSVTSIDTLDYSLPSSQPDCPSLSKEGSIYIQESKKVADDLSRCSESQVRGRDSRESEFVFKSDMTEKQRCEENNTLYSNNGNDAMVGLYRSDQMTEESSQEFLKDVTDIFENTHRSQTAANGPERTVNVAKNVEASVMSSDISSSSFKLSSFILGEQAPEDDAPLIINSSSPSPNDDQGIRWGFSETTEANGAPYVEMTQLHHINNDDTSEEEFVKDPFSSSSLHASNILTHPSDLQSPASNGTDLIKPSFDSQLHNKPKRQSHYWRQPLASSLVRRRPPSPSLICASSYRDELLQEDSSQLHPEKQNLNMSDNLAKAFYSDKDDFGKRFDMNKQHRPGFDGCKSFGDWRRLEPNKQGNLLEEEENYMRQHSHQNERNFINEDIDQQLGFDRCDSSLNWKRQDLIESVDSLEKVNRSQQPCNHSEGKLIKDDISETQRYGFDEPKSFSGWRRLEFNEPQKTLEKVNHTPQLYRNKPNLSKNQQLMSASSQHRVPSMEKQDASRSIDDLFPLVNEDCMPLESVFITSRDTDYHAQLFNRDKGKLDTEMPYENLAFKSQDQMSSHTVSTKQFIERRVPELNSSNISTSFNIQTGRMATPQYLTSSSTLHRKEMSPIIDHSDSCHRKSESSQKVPSLSQRSPSCVTEMSLPDVQPMHIFSQPESVVVSPQCVPCISPVIETEETSVLCNNEEFDSQTEHLRWLEGDDPLLFKTSRIINGTPMVAKVDSFTEEQHDVLVCPREEAREQTVPLVDNSTKNATTNRSSDISKPAKGSQSSLIQAVKDPSSTLISYHQRPSQDDLFSQAAELSTRWKPKEDFPEDDAPSTQATIFKKHLRTPVVAMATEHYEASQLFTDDENAESRKLVQSSVKSFGKDQAQSFCIPDPYPDGQTNNSIYNSLDQSQSGHLTYPGSSSSRWESSEPSQQQEYRNHPEDTWCTPSPRLDTSDFANKTSSHGNLLLQQNDRKEAVAIDRTMTSSISAEKRAGSFQRPLIRDLRQGKVHGLDGRDICAEFFFPTLKDTSTASIPQRQLQIPTKFPDVISYKRVLTAVLKEHVNIILYGVAYNYFSALSKVDISSYSPCSNNGTIAEQNPPCQHKQPSKRVCVKKEGPNKGRFFFACSKARGSQCKFFQWADQNIQRSSKGSSSRPSKEVLSDSKSIEMYVKSFGVSLYCESQLIRKNPFSDHLAGAPAWIRKYRQSKLNSERKKLYLRISRKESSSVYGKDDLWVISKDLTFDPSNSFLAKSVFHGPNTASEVEIEPVSGYSPSNWPGEVTVHALHAYNASTELSCLHNIQEFVNPRILPVLPALLNRYTSDVNSSTILPQKSFKSPAVASPSNRKLFCSSQQIREMAEDVIGQYHLNEDQATALLSVARMFIDEETDGSPVSLIHGVFGAGKSYLLAVTVLFLYRLFHLHQENGGDSNDWKVLISSTTNVAVDRILLSLLQLGFEEFIRVGSIRKIAKPVLPYSVHASDKESQELKELQEMLKGDLSAKEKSFVRKSIERHRLGLNKKMLSKVLVVGVTCAACTFPCITNLKFPVVLLDECSQITEPACLLPVARFECQKLVLVGDPKQLDPTIQGSESAHQFSLEQTLFDRLLLLGYEPTMLRTQYRCHPRISAIANELFYQGKLLDGVDQSQRKELAEGFPTLSFYNVADGRECRTTGGSFLNDKEAVFLVTMLEMLMVSGVEPSQVGVITLYKAQVSHISTLLLQSRLVGLRDLKAIQISTVDAFQGGEKDIIILSCVRSDFMGFAASDKRTNVALTRSKHHLLIVGNQRILSANSLWSKVILKCRECKDGIQDSSSLMREWSAKLDEVMLEEKKTKKKSKRVLKRKEMDEIIQSEFTDSPPLSLDSEDDEEHSIGECTPAVNRSQFKPTENSLQSEITHPPAWTQNQLPAADITSSQTSSVPRVIKHGIAQSVEVAAGTPKIVTSSSSKNSDKGDSVRDVAEEQVLKVRHATDGVFHAADRISVQSGDAIAELARLENSDAGKNLRDNTKTDASLSNSPFSSSEKGKILFSLGTEGLLGSEATSASFEKSPSREGTTTAIWTDDIGSPSYSPLKDVVESSDDDDDDDDELPNFEFDTDFS